MAVELDASAFETARRTMVDCQVRPADVTRIGVIDAMLWAPRERFLPKSRRAQAYMGEHVEVAPGRFELEPRVFAKMLDAADPQEGDLCLCVGVGYGYAASVLSRMTAAVVGVEENATMASAAAATLSTLGVDSVMIETGPLAEGCGGHAPYNLIFVNGAVETLGDALSDQLIDGGRLVAIKMDGAVGRCEVYVKSGGALGVRRAFDASAPVLPGFGRSREFVF